MLKKILAAVAALALSSGFVVATGLATADAAPTAATVATAAVAPQCLVNVIPHDAVAEVSHQEYQYDRVIPGTAAVTHTEWRYQVRTPLYGSKEVKSIKGWEFGGTGSTVVNGVTIPGHWYQGDADTYYVIPDVVINAVWGPSGVPAAYLGDGHVYLSSYGKGDPDVYVAYHAEKVTTSDGYTAYSDWSDWSTTNPGASTDTMNVESKTVTDTAAVPDKTEYYVQGGSPSTAVGDASWITASTLAGWTLFNQKKVVDAAAVDAYFEYVYGDCPTVVPELPVAKDLCGTDNDHYGLPTGPTGITYSRNGLDVVATITAADTYWGTLPTGWVQNTSTTATYPFYNTDWTNVDCYPPVQCVLSGTSDTEAGDLAPVQGIDGLIFDGPTAVGQAKDIYYRVSQGNAQSISGIGYTVLPGSNGFVAQIVIEVDPNTDLSATLGVNHFATLTAVVSGSGVFTDLENQAIWYTNKIAYGDAGGQGNPITYAALVALMPANTLLSAPSLHLQSDSPADAHSVVSSLTSSCGTLDFSLVHVASEVSHTDQTCNVDKTLVGGTITVGITDHVTYTITDASSTAVPFNAVTGATAELAPGTYTVTATADSGYGLDPDASTTVVIGAYGGSCVKDISVTPDASSSDQICSAVTNHLQNGLITVTITTGVDYEITDDSDATHSLIPFDALTGQTAALPPGSYTVHPSVEPGYTLTDPADIHLTIAPYTDFCLQLITHPLVDPSSVQVQLGCDTSGTYTLTSDQVDSSAVVWTVNGSTVAQGTYTVAAAGHYVIDAAPGPGYGFAFGTTTHWVYDFAPPTTCDLKTLALTGGSPEGILTLAGFLTLLGLVLTRRAVVARKTVRG